MTKVTITIPCFNEAKRFLVSEAEALLVVEQLHLILVNDGSTDETLEVLQAFAASHPDRVEVLDLGENRGKAEAVRLGMRQALGEGATVTGYLDADFATSASEMLRLVESLNTSLQTQVLMGARWLHLGANIERNIWRHYGGRVFATMSSVLLDLHVYDTQCGAKLFRANSALIDSLDEPFSSPWAFDVELIGRLRINLDQSAFKEEPLRAWKDVAGSKITLMDMIRATFSLFNIYRALKRRRDSNSLAGHHGKNSGIS